MIAQVWWYATRAAGLMTWASATASVIVGLLLASRALGRRPTGPWLLDLHRYLGGMTMVFLALHLVTLWADSYVEFGLAELFVPGASRWRTGAVAWGVVAAWIVAAVELSSLIRDRLPRRLWHGIHLGSIVAVVMGSIHGWQAGSDVGNRVVGVAAAVAGLAVIGLGAVRLRLRGGAVAAGQQRAAALAQARQAGNAGAAAGPPVPSPRTEPFPLSVDPSPPPRRSEPERAPVPPALAGSGVPDPAWAVVPAPPPRPVPRSPRRRPGRSEPSTGPGPRPGLAPPRPPVQAEPSTGASAPSGGAPRRLGPKPLPRPPGGGRTGAERSIHGVSPRLDPGSRPG